MVGQPELCNGIYTETSAAVHMTHQVVTRTTAKTEFMLGLVSLLTEAIGIEQFQHVQEKIAEVIVALETCRALLRAPRRARRRTASASSRRPGGRSTRAGTGTRGRIQRFPEILRQLGASGLMACRPRPTSSARATRTSSATCRARRWTGPSACASSASPGTRASPRSPGRQTLYEYFFFGDPVRMAGALVASYDREPYKERIRAFLRDGETDGPVRTGEDTVPATM